MRNIKIVLSSMVLSLIFSMNAHAGAAGDAAIASCLKDLKLPNNVCACIGRRVEAELNPKQQKFFVAVVTRNAAAQAEMRKTLTGEEMSQIGAFVTSAPQRCAGG